MMAGKPKIPCHVGNRMKAQDLWSKERFTFTPRKRYAVTIQSPLSRKRARGVNGYLVDKVKL